MTKRKEPPAHSSSSVSKSNAVEQLNLLREFVTDARWTESDLLTCWKQCGYNVERAAEYLLTGKFVRPSKLVAGTTKNSMHGSTKSAYFNTLKSEHQQTHSSPRYVSLSSSSSSSVASASTRIDTIYSTPGCSSNKRPRVSLSSNESYCNNDTGLVKLVNITNAGNEVIELDSSTNDTCSVHYNEDGTLDPLLSMEHIQEHEQEAKRSPSVRDLLLCKRWVYDGVVCTTKNGRIDYNEVLSLEHSISSYAQLRFRGKNCEGRLPDAVAKILTPIFRHEQDDKQNGSLLQVTVTALMEQQQLMIGTEVPISITVVIVDPVRFFDLMKQSENLLTGNYGKTSADSSRHYFAKLEKKSMVDSGKRCKNVLPVSEAAYMLLQWAQYGSENFPDNQKTRPDGETNERTSSKVANKSTHEVEKNLDDTDLNVADDDDQDGIEMNENDFEEASVEERTAEGKELFEQSVSSNSSKVLPELDDPTGFKNGITLRPYQKQALFFLRQREIIGSSRQELDEQLQLLSELANERNNQHHSNQPQLSAIGNTAAIICDCSPVIVSGDEQQKSRTIIDNRVNPINHPLWQRRYLASMDMTASYVFYVNEMTRSASLTTPIPPQPCSGGILADAMGLGKTVMLIALILQRKNDCLLYSEECTKKNAPSTTLVIAKLSLLTQWEDEIISKSNLTVRIVYGDSAIVTNDELSNVDVVVTTYGTIQAEFKRKNSTMLGFHWFRVILDEAHCIRNCRTLASKACCALQANHRWCVSGTIIQNSLNDIFGIMKFLHHEPWCIPAFWSAAIDQPSSSASNKSAKNNPGSERQTDESSRNTLQLALSRTRRLLAPIMLRRSKDTLSANGEPILTLPPVETKVIEVNLNEAEREFYNSLLTRSLEVFDGFVTKGTVSTAYFQIFSLLQRLRQACDHIALTMKSSLDDAAWNNFHRDDSEKQEIRIRSKISTMTVEEGSTTKKKDAVQGDFLNELMSKFFRAKPCSLATIEGSSDHIVKCSSSSPNASMSNCSNGAYLSSTARDLSTSMMQSGGALTDECPLCLEIPKVDEAVLTPCAHIFCRNCLVGFFRSSAAKAPKTAGQERRKNTSIQDSVSIPDGECPICMEKVCANNLIAFVRDENKSMTTAFVIPPTKSRQDLCQQRKPIGSAKALTVLENVMCTPQSSKINSIMNELRLIWRHDAGSKVLIFSHYLGFLDLLGSQLRMKDITFYRIDGSLPIKERMQILNQFRECKKDVEESSVSVCSETGREDDGRTSGIVLLMSMSAGGEGLNITCASTCFIVEPWWNIAKEDQCINRIHRIGQTARQVRVRKFIVRDTVEERIVELQKRKSLVASAATRATKTSDEDDEATMGGESSKLTMDDLRIIFSK